MQQICIDGLPENALDAAAEFCTSSLPQIESLLARSDLLIVLPPAAHDHADWRRAMARDLARKHAPSRVNIVGGKPGVSLDSTIGFLARNAAITGQYLRLRDE